MVAGTTALDAANGNDEEHSGGVAVQPSRRSLTVGPVAPARAKVGAPRRPGGGGRAIDPDQPPLPPRAAIHRSRYRPLLFLLQRKKFKIFKAISFLESVQQASHAVPSDEQLCLSFRSSSVFNRDTSIWSELEAPSPAKAKEEGKGGMEENERWLDQA